MLVLPLAQQPELLVHRLVFLPLALLAALPAALLALVLASVAVPGPRCPPSRLDVAAAAPRRLEPREHRCLLPPCTTTTAPALRRRALAAALGEALSGDLGRALLLSWALGRALDGGPRPGRSRLQHGLRILEPRGHRRRHGIGGRGRGRMLRRRRAPRRGAPSRIGGGGGVIRVGGRASGVPLRGSDHVVRRGGHLVAGRLHPHARRRLPHVLAGIRPLLLVEGLSLLTHHLSPLRLLHRLPCRRLAPPLRERARLSKA